MYNKVKRIFTLITGILCIVIGGVSCLCTVVSLNLPSVVLIMSSLIFGVGLGVPLIVIGTKLCKPPVKYNGVWENLKKFHIILIVFSAVILLYSVISFSTLALYITANVADVAVLAIMLHYVNFILSIGAVATNIVSMSIKADRGSDCAKAYSEMSTEYNYGKVSDGRYCFPACSQTPAQTEQIQYEKANNNADPVNSMQASSVDAFDSIDQKVKKLKEWKDENIITEEQYNEAVKKILNNIS